ncbi:hypothetical protein AAVH_27042 [Aphelenchoides avenae]|nr:hypothetical protein AAVH_27042 [Aphelenchus avenae]
MFAVQLFMAFQTFVETTDLNGLLGVYYDLIHQELYGVPRWLQLSSKQWLAGDAKCEVDWLKVEPDVGPKYCGTLYMVLTGNQVLVVDITVASLINNLFALSGSAFLLIVSGTVRKAYTQFYFGRLRKKPITVIQVTSQSERSTRQTAA